MAHGNIMYSERNVSPELSISAIAAAVATCLLIAVTPWGLGLTPDSINYLEAALHWYTHADFGEFSSHWAPLLPVLVGTITHLTGDPALAAKFLISTALFFNVVMVGILLTRLMRLPGWAYVLSIVSICLSPGFFGYHLLFWTEPLFVTLLLLNLYVLERIFRDQTVRPLVIAVILGLITGAAIMMRYAGVFLLALNVVSLVLVSSLPLRLRLMQTAISTAIACTPLAVWVLYNVSRGAGGTNRSLAWHPPADHHYEQLAITLSHWFNVPATVWEITTVIIIILAGWVGIQERRNIAGICGQVVVLYSTFIFLSISIADFHTPLDTRILAPIFVPVAFVLIYTLGWVSIRLKLPRWSLTVLLAVILFTTLDQTYGQMRKSLMDGIGFADRSLNDLPIVQVSGQLPKNANISTNGPEILITTLGRSGTKLPRHFDPNNAKVVPGFREKMAELSQSADVIIYFSSMKYRSYLATPEQIAELAPFVLVYRQPDGAIWVTESYLGEELRE